MTKISVVVPIYNNEKYLENCIASICNQIFKDIEIILVDDGSTDSSPKICDEFAKKDGRIKVIHKENAGLGVAYNTGINAAEGEYIGFVESDDFINEHMYGDLYELAAKSNVDIVKSGWFEYTQNSIVKNYSLYPYNSYEILKPQYNPWILRIQFSVWSAIYKKEFLKNNNVYYLETPGASFQDVGFSYKALTQAKNIIMTPNAYYFYRCDNENASVKSKEKSEVIFWEYEEVDKFFDKNPQIKSWANTDKLIKQYYDYTWNYNRIIDTLKENFLIKYSKDFQKYNKAQELSQIFWENIDSNFLNSILNIEIKN